MPAAFRYAGPGRGFVQTTFTKLEEPIARAATSGLRDVAALVKRGGQENIRNAGFKSLVSGFQTRVTPRSGYSLDASMIGFHRLGWVNIFETGGTIRGKKGLLWIPLPSAPLKVGGKKTTPRLLSAAIGRLHSINRGGKPMLAGYVPRALEGRRATVGQLRNGNRNARRQQAARAFGGRVAGNAVLVPLFIGVSSVQIRARLNITDVYKQAREQLGGFYFRRLREIR